MNTYNKWLNIAIVFILSFSLLSPAAIAEVQESEPNELDTSSNTNNFDEHSIQSNWDTSQISTNALSSNITSDGAEIDVTTLNEAQPSGYVTISVEKFTIGQGYAIEPIQVPFYDGEMVGQVVARLLESGNYNNGSTDENIVYLANIRDSESIVNIPQYIQTEIAKDDPSIRGKADSDWLGQFDYTNMSGWMYTVNHELPSFGMSEYENINEDVIRLQFSVYGYGRDLGFGFDDWETGEPIKPYIEVANKDALTAKIAKINSAPNKDEILANANVKSAYDDAYEQLTNMESSQTNVDAALAQLNSALNGNNEEIVEADTTALQSAIQQAELNKASVKVSEDGQDIDPTDYWVSQAVLEAYTNVIVEAQQLIADENAIQTEIDAKVLALDQATDVFNAAKSAGLQTVVTSEIKFTVAPKAVKLKLYDTNEQEISIGVGVEGTYNVYTATIATGNYRYEGFDSNNKSVGGGQLTVTTEANQEFQFRQLNFKASNTGWTVDNDYTVKVGQDMPSDTSLKLGDVTEQGQIPVLALAGKTFFYTFEPDAKHTEFITLSDSRTITIGTSAQAISAAIPFSGNITFTVPQDAQLFVGKKIKHFISFEEVLPKREAEINQNGTKTYAFKLVNGGSYNYRVSQEGKLTNTGTFTANAQNATLEITKEQLEIQSPQAILNKGTYLEGNIYLNINEQNHLKLNQGDNFKLLPLRSWQALIEGINNYFFEPDFHYEIITGNDVVEIEPGKPGSSATVNALKNGTAIVKVTYDALKVNGSTYIKDANDAFSAIWPENVGLFVVTVGQGEMGISTGIESNKERNRKANEGKTGNAIMNLQNGIFDADIDSVYYVQGEPGAYYTFKPSSGSSVSVLRPIINHDLGTVSYGDGTFSTENAKLNIDDSFTILLTEGRNIVKVEKDGKSEYHVMTARPLDVIIENLTTPNKEIVPGDKVNVTLKGLSFPANKLSGIYNFQGQLRFFAGPENTLVLGDARQYNMTTQANSITFTIPSEHNGEYSLRNGHIRVSSFGSPIGDHRNIDPTVGANPNFTASGREGYYSIFPTITIIDGPTDKVELQTAIEKAEQNKASVKVSKDGKDVDPTEKWVTQAELDEYANVIVSAQQLIADETATQEGINAKVLALNQATDTFNKAKKPGTKPNVNTPTQQAYNTVGKYMVDKLHDPKFGNEWWIIALARGGYEVPAGYYDTYYNNVVDYVVSKDGELDKRKYTEYSRLIIALTAIGKDPTNVGGYNLIEKLSDFDKVVWQGINGAYFALIALDTWDFELPETATTTREKLIDFILDKQLADKGWALSGTKADPDMTGMAIQSLAPYYNSNPKVKEAVDNALTTLAALQLENGGYKTWGIENVESAAQVVTALASLGLDANKDPRFNKVIGNIMTYYSVEDGGFKHVLTETKANGMATEQAGYTLAAYHRLLNGQTALYDTSDAKSNNPSNPGDGGNNPSNPGNGGDNNNPGGNLPYGDTKFLIRISSSEVPLRATTVELYPGETVFDVLKRVTAENGISLSYRETQYGTYIDGIAGLYEFDRGPLSGWMYRVNGNFPSYSAALYTLSPGDFVEWLYTLDLGKDIGGYVDGIENGGAPGGEVNAECKKGKTEDCKVVDKDSTVVEISTEEGSDKAFITAEKIQQFIDKNIQKLVIKSEKNFKLEVPTSSFKGITLAKGEKVVVSVTTEPGSKQFTANFGIETAKGRIKPISLDKDYLKVTLPADDVKPNTVVLQLVGGKYKPVPHKIANGEIVLFTKTSGTFIVTEKHFTFKDIEKLANKDEIEFLANRLVIQGVTPDTFEPNKPITRAQFAALLSRSLGLQILGENPFSDTAGKWYANDVQALYEAGITKGTTASTFNPEDPITRQQAAAFMARILEYLNIEAQVTGEANFKDAGKISAEYLPYIELLNSLEIMTGKQDGSFDPGASLKRAQTVKILKHTLNIADMM
ncbi:S-layer homology domain-containing protein [Psychrobacillus sp. FSL H8-0484]|uniref:S-layer homology domain-containing protein n=1 Tax=Psychrobacillus sp. FSL H8-0484 TaxID=2921390 RepID=UPI0030F628B7